MSHTDAALAEAVRKGRIKEFASFAWGKQVPDPNAVGTFEASRLDHALKASGPNASMLGWYRELLKLRREHPALQSRARAGVQAHVDAASGVLVQRRRSGEAEALLLSNLSGRAARVAVDDAPGSWVPVVFSGWPVEGAGGGDCPGSFEVDGPAVVEMPAWGFLFLESVGSG